MQTDRPIRCACVLAAFLVTAGATRADTVALIPVKDNTIYEDPSGGRSNGAGVFMFAGRNSQPMNSKRRALLAFDVAGSIPAGAAIVGVRLTLATQSNSAGSTIVALHRITSSWGEGTSDAGIPGGGGAPPSPGDATWIHRFFSGDLWSVTGGDFDPVHSAAQSVLGVGPVTWASTPAMVGDVQGWLDVPATNNGWVLLGDESAGGTGVRWSTRENPVPSDRPTLIVEFIPRSESVPTVSQWGMIMLTTLLLTMAKIRFSAPRARRRAT